ncbi:hypothetical protein [Streptomyces gardneri]|uniref:Uncharacterized protein n=1 Tax=Streptomyces gardneri TaxID=66892 RepID=A0A4Y3RJE9_9ACTN|nr:hypothetical protein [Streptomyces gardneri]GEB56813.1 hypothetical protein SGA01_24180 [Streptomyces gardneri]GHG85642.1 hypothetical protein GCM10017674_09710 [Streptomyces gardneri]
MPVEPGEHSAHQTSRDDFGTAVFVERQKLGQEPGCEPELLGAGAAAQVSDPLDVFEQSTADPRGRGAGHPGARDDGDLAEDRSRKEPNLLTDRRHQPIGGVCPSERSSGCGESAVRRPAGGVRVIERGGTVSAIAYAAVRFDGSHGEETGMGGNAWTQTGPYQPDLAAAFRQAQDGNLAEDDHGFGGRSIEELWRDPAWHEYIFTGGTGTVLDFPHMIDATDRSDGPFMRPLTDSEVRAWSPSGQPTYEDWDAALDSGRLEFPDGAQGNCTVLYRDGRPASIGYWGVTAD